MVYDFTREVINPKTSSICQKDSEKLRHWKIDTSISLNPSKFGAGSKVSTKSERLGNVIRRSSVSQKTGNFLYRFSKWIGAQYILELGTSVGISGLYLANSNPNATIVTLEGDGQRAMIAKMNFEHHNYKNIEIIEGDFDTNLNFAISKLPRLDLVFFDGNHRAEPTIRYFKQCLNFTNSNTVFVFDDIRWSKEMFKAWEIISQDQSVSISIDLFSMGVVFFRKGIIKQHFQINF
jgi:predicted O-methyltransferase YrrM